MSIYFLIWLFLSQFLGVSDSDKEEEINSRYRLTIGTGKVRVWGRGSCSRVRLFSTYQFKKIERIQNKIDITIDN